MMFSITGSQIFFVNFVIFARNKQKTSYQFIVHTTTYLGGKDNLQCFVKAIVVLRRSTHRKLNILTVNFRFLFEQKVRSPCSPSAKQK